MPWPPRRGAPWAVAATTALLLLLALLTPAHAARLALVIGNKDYTVGRLTNPINDAEDMAALLGGLGGLGFSVTLVRNLQRDDIGRTVEGFASRIRPGDDVLGFYAGHGLQVKGVNYLPAVDARISVEADVPLNSLNLNELLQRLDEARAGVRLLLVDACRDNPYSRGFRSTARGLARVEGAPSGTLMHFATRPGGVAGDGAGRNGTYTAELLRHLRTPGLPVESVLKRVASGVRQATGGSQQPWTEGALDGEFYIAPGGSSVTVAPAAQAVPAPSPLLATCALCPPMVVVPAGGFMMGSPASETGRYSDEGPQRRVAVAGFELGKTEITQGQWKAVMGSNPSAFKDCGDNCPVENVSWDDAQAFIRKLNEQTGRRYRLPSEAEWEYAARAGSTTAYPWGAVASHEHANYGKDECCAGLASGKDRWVNTAPVGQFPPNAFGLHDMHGNVREWVLDVWHDNYTGAPTDGSAWLAGGNQARRVLRGGSWGGAPQDLRSANRGGYTPDNRNVITGFRIARTL